MRIASKRGFKAEGPRSFFSNICMQAISTGTLNRAFTSGDAAVTRRRGAWVCCTALITRIRSRRAHNVPLESAARTPVCTTLPTHRDRRRYAPLMQAPSTVRAADIILCMSGWLSPLKQNWSTPMDHSNGASAGACGACVCCEVAQARAIQQSQDSGLCAMSCKYRARFTSYLPREHQNSRPKEH